jgi:alkanesulfonate monooxygenase SsuD/methylene tetrahydromethanopterin reductase-like flavin-dependent oxidoreductase (luciferase family)
MRFSFVMLPDHPVAELLDVIELADELGFYACYGADETYHKDSWQILAAAAARTTRIRLGPDVTHVILKDPTLIAQQIATLDELTNGRAECGYSIGNFGMLEQYHLAELAARPLRRLREAHKVMRTLLDEGSIDFEGEYYRYTGLFTSARPVQARLPIFIGAMRGPKSFQLAGEIADGMHQAIAYSPEAMEYAVANIRIGAERTGRDWRELDIGAMMVASVAEDSQAAKDAARVVAAFYISSMPRELVERHGIDPDELQPIVDAFTAGDVERGAELTTPELGEKLSCAGSPMEIVEQIRRDVEPSGFNHVIFMLTDPFLVETWSGLAIDNVPDLAGQLRLIHDHVMPEFQ